MALDWVGEGGSSIVGWWDCLLWDLVLGTCGVEYRGKTTSGAKQPVCVCVWGGGNNYPSPLTRGWSYPD